MGCGSSSATDASRGDALAEPTSKFTGIVAIQVVAAHDLRAKVDKHSLGDPFMILSHGGRTWRTKTVHDKRNPVWNQTLGLTMNEISISYDLVLDIYDKDAASSNDLMGHGVVPLSGYLDGKIHEITIDVTTTENTTEFAGNVDLVIQFRDEMDMMKLFWRKLGSIYSTDGAPGLSRLEFGALLEGLGGHADEQSITQLFSDADTDGDGTVSYDELCRFAQKTDLNLKASANPTFLNFQTQGLKNEDVLAMYAARFTQDGSESDFVTGGFITVTEASKGWASRVSEFLHLTHKANLGNVKNGHILVQRRDTGQLIEERIPPYVRAAIRLLYQRVALPKKTHATNALLRKLTFTQGKKYDDPQSAKSIPGFVKQYDLDMNEVEKPLAEYKTYNEFFYRKLKVGARPIASPGSPDIAVAPADCRLHVFNTVSQATELWIKGKHFSIEKLLGSDRAAPFIGGQVCIARLAPQDYHRFHFSVDGKLGEPTTMPGEYYTVNPMAIYSPLDVFGDNVRVVSIIDSNEFGKVAYVSIGATLVGSVNLTSRPGNQVHRGEEHGYFAFGGSTCVLLFQPGAVEWDSDLLANSEKRVETLVQMGEQIGRATPKYQ